MSSQLLSSIPYQNLLRYLRLTIAVKHWLRPIDAVKSDKLPAADSSTIDFAYILSQSPNINPNAQKQHFQKSINTLPPLTPPLWCLVQKVLHKRYLSDPMGGYALGWLVLQRMLLQPEIEKEGADSAGDLPIGEIAFYASYGAARWMQSTLRADVITQIEFRWGGDLPELWRQRIEWSGYLTPWTTPNFETTRHVLNRLAPQIRGADWHPFFEIECVRSHAFGNMLHQKFEQAEQILQAGLAWTKAHSYSLGEAIYCIQMGILEKRRRRLQKADAWIETAFQNLTIKRDRVSLIQGWTIKGFVAFTHRDEFTYALECFQIAGTISNKTLLKGYKNEIYNHKIAIFREQGNYDQSIHILEALVKERKKGTEVETSLQADNWLELGVMYEKKGESVRSIDCFYTALQLRPLQGENKRYEVIYYNNVGISLWSLGNYQAGLSHLDKAIMLNEEKGDKEKQIRGHLEESLAQMWLEIGNLSQAEEHFARSKEIFLELGYRSMDMPLLELGLTLTLEKRQRGQGSSANQLEIFEASIAEAGRRGRKLHEYRFYGILGMYVASLGRHSEAIAYLTQGVEGCAKLGANLDRYKLLLPLGNSHLACGNSTAAERCWQTLLEEGSTHPQLTSQAALKLGEMLIGQGELEQGVDYLRNGLDLLNRMRGRSTQANLSGGYFAQTDRLVWHSLNRLVEHDVERSTDVAQLLMRCKSRALLEQMVRLGTGELSDPNIVAELDSVRQSLTSTAVRTRESRDGLLNQASIGKPNQELIKLANRYTRLADRYERGLLGKPTLESRHDWNDKGEPLRQPVFDVSFLQWVMGQLWGESWLAIDFLVTEEQITVITIDSQGTCIYQQPKPPSFKTSIDQIGDGSGPAAGYYLGKLGDALFPPELVTRLHADLVLLIAPHGESLHNLPWSALSINGRFLIELAQPLIVPSLAIYSQLWVRYTERVSHEAVGAKILGLAVDDFPHLPKLKYAVAEIKQIQSLFGQNGEWLAAAGATFARLQQLAQEEGLAKFDLWHIASHGVFNERFEGRVCGFALYDTEIYTAEIGRLTPLPGAVFLSACSGVPLKVFGGDEVSGLPPALLSFGAQTVLGSIWPVADRAALNISNRFYQRWDRNPTEGHLARMTAVLRALSGEPVDQWGGYRVIGLGM